MSVIGSVSDTSSGLTLMLQRLAGQSDESAKRIGARGSPPEGPPKGGDGMLTDKVGTFAEAAGLDSETVTSLQEQLSSAISAALDEADESTDPREAIDGAILSTLEEYGLDGEAFLSELKASMPTGGPSMSAMGSDLSTSDIVSQAFELMNGGASDYTYSASMSLLDTLA